MSLKKKKEMTTLFRKLSSRRSNGSRFRGSFERSSSGEGGSSRRGSGPPTPVCPPSPTLGHLTTDEIRHLNTVFSRLEEFELEEQQRVTRLQQEVRCYEDLVRQQNSTKSRLKQIDLRLCRLCFKTKFADGIGRLCHDCHKRVCNRCGSFTRDTAEHKRNKVRWRCNLCKMRRELVCATGVWFHGGQAEPLLNTQTFRRKLGDAGIQSDYGIQADVEQSDSTSSNPFGHRTDSELARLVGSREENSRGRRQSRRRLTSTSDDQEGGPGDEEDLEEDDEHFLQEREKCRQERLQLQYKKSKRRHKRASVGTSTEEDALGARQRAEAASSTTSPARAPCPRHGSPKQGTPPSSHSKNNSPSLSGPRTPSSQRGSGDRGKPPNRSGARGKERAPRRQPSMDQVMHPRDRNPREMRGGGARSDSRPPGDKKYRHELAPPELNPKGCNSPPPRPRGAHRKGPRKSSITQIVDNPNMSPNLAIAAHQEGPRKRSCPNCATSLSSPPVASVRRSASSASQLNRGPNMERLCSCTSDPGLLDVSNINLLNPHLSTFQKEKLSTSNLQMTDTEPSSVGETSSSFLKVPPVHQESTSFQIPDITCSSHSELRGAFVCGSSGPVPASPPGKLLQVSTVQEDGKTSTHAHGQGQESIPDDTKKISTCSLKSTDEIISIGGGRTNSEKDMKIKSKRVPFRRSSSCSHFRVVLQRDPKDKSCRTGGLGMRMVGGKIDPDGGLSAFIAFVQSGGPADLAGISEGDQILEWDGSSLKDATFEEVQQILSKSGDTVQLVVVRSRRSLEGGSDESHKKMPQWHRASMRGLPSLVTTLSPPSLDPEQPPEEEEDKGLLRPSRPLVHRRFSDEDAYKMQNRIELMERVEALDEPEPSSDGRPISGRIEIKLHYNPRSYILTISVIGATNLSGRPCPNASNSRSESGTSIQQVRRGSGNSPSLTPAESPCPFCKFKLLPKDRTMKTYRTEVSPPTCNPQWNHTFSVNDIKADQLARLSLLVTVWDYYPQKLDVFIGEVLLDLLSANLQEVPVWYPLEDHDENMGPAPQPSPKTNHHQFSQMEVEEEEGRQPWHSLPVLPETPAHNRIKEMLNKKGSPLTNLRNSAPALANYKVNAQDSSLKDASDTSAATVGEEGGGPSGKKGRGGISYLKRRMSEVALKVGALLADKRDVPGAGNRPSRQLSCERRYSVGGVTNLKINQESSSGHVMSSLMAGDTGLSGASSQSSAAGFNSSTPQSEQDNDPSGKMSSGESSLTGDDVAAMLGPGQIAPKAIKSDLLVKGDVKLSFIVTKGQLELEIFCAKGLPAAESGKPDTYVKTYLVDAGRKIQKKKTKTVKGCQDPLYMQKIKYSACNVSGRHIQVQVKAKASGFDKNTSLGEALVRLDDIELSSQTSGWYKLFRAGAVEVGSVDSLHF